MKTLSFVVPLLLACAAVPVRSQLDPGIYAFDRTTVRVEKVRPVSVPSGAKPPAAAGSAAGALPSLEQIVNIGQKVWKIIDDNKPVADVKNQYATALPKGLSNWADLGGWSPPAGEVYELTAENGYGMKAISVRYQVLRTYGGSRDGKGRYLTAVTVEPLLVEVGWGYHFTMTASVPDTSVVNVGTSSDPVAGMMAALSWRISTPIKDAQGQALYFLQGDGAFEEIGGPFSGRSLDKAKEKIAAESGQGAGRSATMGP